MTNTSFAGETPLWLHALPIFNEKLGLDGYISYCSSIKGRDLLPDLLRDALVGSQLLPNHTYIQRFPRYSRIYNQENLHELLSCLGSVQFLISLSVYGDDQTNGEVRKECLQFSYRSIYPTDKELLKNFEPNLVIYIDAASFDQQLARIRIV